MDEQVGANQSGQPQSEGKPRRAFVLTESTLVYTAEPGENQERQDQSTTVRVESHIPVEIRRDRISVLFAFLAALISAATLIVVARYTYFAGGQWNEMIRNTEIQSKTLRISQRAWLVPSIARMEDFEKEKDFRIWQLIPNNGPSPAKNVTAVGTICKWELGDKGKHKNQICDTSPSGKGILINSGGGYNIPFHWAEVNGPGKRMVIEQSELDYIVKWVISIRINGTIAYDDIFDHHHWVNFCSEYAWDERQFVKCATGNDMDPDPE